jgi:hypothetical protein
MRHVLAVLCSVLIVGCAVEDGIGAHAVWLNTPDAGDGCPIVCDPAGGFTADGCCEAAQPQPVAPPQTIVISPLNAAVKAGWVADFNGFVGTSRGFMASTGAGRFAVPLPLREGDRMLSLTVAASGNLSADLDITSFSVAPNGDLTLGTVGFINQPNAPSGFNDYTADLTDTTVAGGVSYWFEVSADQAGMQVGALRLTYDHPQ